MIRRLFVKTPIYGTQLKTFFWGPRSPFDSFERELRRFEDEFKRWNRDMLNSWDKNQNSKPGLESNNKDVSLFKNPFNANKSLESEQTYVDKEGNKNLKLSFDVAHFAPEDIKIKIDNKSLSITAKKDERTPKGTIYREFVRECLLPDNIDIEHVKSDLSSQGTLTLEVPYKKHIDSGIKSDKIHIPIEKGDS